MEGELDTRSQVESGEDTPPRERLRKDTALHGPREPSLLTAFTATHQEVPGRGLKMITRSVIIALVLLI